MARHVPVNYNISFMASEVENQCVKHKMSTTFLLFLFKMLAFNLLSPTPAVSIEPFKMRSLN